MSTTANPRQKTSNNLSAHKTWLQSASSRLSLLAGFEYSYQPEASRATTSFRLYQPSGNKENELPNNATNASVTGTPGTPGRRRKPGADAVYGILPNEFNSPKGARKTFGGDRVREKEERRRFKDFEGGLGWGEKTVDPPLPPPQPVPPSQPVGHFTPPIQSSWPEKPQQPQSQQPQSQQPQPRPRPQQYQQQTEYHQPNATNQSKPQAMSNQNSGGPSMSQDMLDDAIMDIDIESVVQESRVKNSISFPTGSGNNNGNSNIGGISSNSYGNSNVDSWGSMQREQRQNQQQKYVSSTTNNYYNDAPNAPQQPPDPSYENNPKCDCGDYCAVRTSSSASNPDRDYYCCVKPQSGGKCNYFLWKDEFDLNAPTCLCGKNAKKIQCKKVSFFFAVCD